MFHFKNYNLFTLYFLKGPLLHVLKRRLAKDLIYTDIGDVLISVNPFKKIENLYEDPLKYLNVVNDYIDDDNKSEHEKLKPHVYKVSNSALKLLMKNQGNQSVVVSGESGAGKTEASKHAINFFISSNDKLLEMVDAQLNSETIKVGDHIKKIISVSSIVLESFGNSKTMRNDNSSRFGKYIKINYTNDNRISSAVTETFLLEKSRLVSVGNNERNYHIFYELIQGIHFFDPELKIKLNLNSVESFNILTQGNCIVIGSVEKDINEFGELYRALRILDCSPEELEQLWSMLACILHLGNVIVTQEDLSKQANIECPTFPMIEIAKILGVDNSLLVLTLTTWAVRIGNRKSINLKILSVEDVHNNIHALMKWLYQNVFTWLVDKINRAFESKEASHKFIGILDIFGFEILQKNSFEQLCINYSNECLQKQFNQHVFESEQELYDSEGLNWTTISFEDNQIVLDLINKKNTGLFAILEEHAMMNRKPDDSLLLVSFNQAQFGISSSYAKPRFGKETFIVKHFAGDVEYVIDGFLMKNNDSLQEDLIDLMSAPDGINIFIPRSNNSTEILPPVPGQGKDHRKKMASALTVSNVFRHQLAQLMNTLGETKRHYIKCIKPNNEKSPLIFNSLLVNEQLRYSGALEVVRIRKEGYPTRVNFKDFYRTNEKLVLFKGWTASNNCSEEEAIKYCSIIAEEFLGKDMFQIGKTYLFLRNKAIAIMRECLMLRMAMYASRIQAGIRCYLTRRLFKLQKKYILTLQCLGRMFINKKSFKVILKKKRDHDAAVEKARLEAIATVERLRIQKEKEEARIRAEIEAARLEAIKVEEERLIAIEKQKAHELRLLQDRNAEEARVRQAALDEAARIVAEKELALKIAAQLVIDKANSTIIIIKYVVRFFHNLKLKRRIESLYIICETDNLTKLKLHLADFSDDINIRYKFRNFTTLYHTALISGSKLICNYIQELTNGFLLKNGANGDNSIHLITQLSNFNDKTFSLLVDSMNKMSYNENESDSKSNNNDTSNQEISNMNNLINFLRNDRMSDVSNQNPSVKSGWLKKRKEGKNLHNRWVEITTTEISYYKSDKDKIPQRKLPLIGSFMTRVEGKEPILKINCPNLEKKSFFGSNEKTFYFQCESELQLQEWLLVFRALLEIKPFRLLPSISYVDIKKRYRALSSINSVGETPLHTLARSQSLNEKDSEKKINLGMWLIENGCPVNLKNNFNHTASDIAAENNNKLLKECIESKINVDMNQTHLKSVTKIPGYSYLSIYLENQSFLINR